MYAVQTTDISLKVNRFELKNISIQIPASHITTIVGPNGSGKSTILKVISNLLKADSGLVYIDKKEKSTYKAKEFAKKITMLLQSKGNLPNLTVQELVAYGRTPHQSVLRQTKTLDEDIVLEALELTETLKYKDRLFNHLSGGEQQKVRIAMALAQQTDILLLDEPTTYLDISHQYDVMELLTEINRKKKITVIMVLHDLQQAAMYSDYLIAMKDGEITDSGIPSAILTTEFLERIYDIQAEIRFEHNYPIIIPNLRGKKNVYCHK